MAKRTTYQKDDLSYLKDKRRFARRLGKVLRPNGNTVSKRFLLSREEATARFQAARLEALWLWAIERHEENLKSKRRVQSDAFMQGNTAPVAWFDLPDEPVWNLPCGGHEMRAEEVANAIASGQTELAFELPALVLNDSEAITHTDMDWARALHDLNQTYNVFGVHFVAVDPGRVVRGQTHFAQTAERRAEQAARAASIAEVSVKQGPSMTAHEAADRYVAMIDEEPDTEHNRREASRIERIKEAIPNVPLRDFDYDAIQRLGAHWRNRPPSRAYAAKGKPMAIATVKHFMKTSRRMIDWWDASDSIPWDAPKRWQRAVKLNTKAIMTEEERLNLDLGPATWTIDELTVLYKIATDWERALLLMQINLGYAQSEIESWRWADTHLQDDPPQVRRNRRKTSGYFEAALWTETVKAVEWLRQRSGDSPWVVLNTNGERVNSSRLANSWNSLLKRAREYQRGFRSLSFRMGRKTAFTMVEQASTREIAGIFEARSQVTTDKFADVYGPRLFDRVREANLSVEMKLAGVFATAPNAFTSPWTGGSSNISCGKIELIRNLWQEGASASAIAKATGVSRQTVYRHHPKLAEVE